MKPLSVTLVHRKSDNYRRLTGWWSYPVPEFTWQTVPVDPVNFRVTIEGKPDLVVLDDWIFGKVNKNGSKMAYVTVDSARSDDQLRRNIHQSADADLILVDSDRLDRFAVSGKPVRRFAYAVNEWLYKPTDKVYDVAFLCWPTPERRIVQGWAEEICKKHGWLYLTGTYTNPLDYAAALCTAKIVIHKQHVTDARSWRVFDVMAAMGCLLSNPIPQIDGDEIVPGWHYHEYNSAEELEQKLAFLLENDRWREVAKTGYAHVMKYHTWRTRSEQLRMMLGEVLGL